jgi:DNA-directed RNA polymerase I, II, and III subunit RPABC5
MVGIFPIRCMNCGNMIADKWRFYQEQIQKAKLDKQDVEVYFDGNKFPNTAEKQILDTMGLTRSCCRKHFLTHVDLINQIG